MQLKLAGADFTFPLLTHDQALDLLAMLDYQGVDIGLFEERSHLQPSHVIPDIKASAHNLAAKVHERGLEFADIFFQASSFEVMAANHPDLAERSKSRQFFLQMLEFTHACAARHMTGLPGVRWPTESAESSIQRAADELAWRVDQARQADITFSVEPHLGSVTPTPTDVQRLLAAAPELTLTLDYTHFTYQGIPDTEVEPLIAHASHFHARGACRGRLQAPRNENVIDYAQVLREMQRVGYQGYVGVEYVWQEWERNNEVDTISESIMLRDHLRAFEHS